MKATFFKGAVVGGIAGAICAAGTVALAGTGIGGVFNLGGDNTVNGQTQLRGNTGGNPQLRVNNQQERTPPSACSASTRPQAARPSASRARPPRARRRDRRLRPGDLGDSADDSAAVRE